MEIKRSRAAILPFPGDPFLLHYWLELFYRVWSDEIDKLYVICNSMIEKKVVEYIEFLCTADPGKIDFTYIDHQVEHGTAIRIGLEKATEEYVMLVEDDAYIFKPGIVNECFEKLESGEYDIVGSKRGSCHPEILNRAKQIWGIAQNGFGDQGCNFWPCYFFSKRTTLLQTDRDFSARAWVQGEIIAPLQDYVVEAPLVASDTFVWASLQLRAMIPERRIHYVAQYHAHPDDKKHFETRAANTPFDGYAKWTHIGSLSSGVGGVLMDDDGRSLAVREVQPPHGPTVLPTYCQTEMEIMEMERRVQFWQTFYDKRDPKEIPEFAELYRKAIERICYQYRLNRKRILERQRIYREAFNL